MAIIDKPSDYFNTVLYTGNGASSRAISVGFQSDWVWNKPRTNTNDYQLVDSVRGGGKVISSNLADAEYTAGNTILSFGSDGFTCGDGASVNANGVTYASWNWVAGGSASNNTDGNTTTSVSVNQDAGFSIMKYAGDGNDSTIGHGLGAKPEYIIFKEIDGAESWRVWSKYTPDTASKALALNLTDAAFSQSGWIGAISTSTISIGTDSSINTNGNNYIAYAFSPKQGYSKFGAYTGNGNADGTFVYTGFKPAFLMVKSTGSGGWLINDTKRSPHNITGLTLYADSSASEESYTIGASEWDFLSNGFKNRDAGSAQNTSGTSYIYMAFAENPFVASNFVPTTAR